MHRICGTVGCKPIHYFIKKRKAGGFDMTKQNRKTPAVFYVGVALLCAVLITSHLTSGLYARYTTTASGGDRAVVASFEVGETSSSIPQTLDVSFNPTSDTPQYVRLSNTGEVVVRYTISVDNLTGTLPISFAAKEGVLSPNEQVDVGFLVEWSGTKDAAFSGMVDLIRIKVSIEQKQ